MEKVKDANQVIAEQKAKIQFLQNQIISSNILSQKQYKKIRDLEIEKNNKEKEIIKLKEKIKEMNFKSFEERNGIN